MKFDNQLIFCSLIFLCALVIGCKEGTQRNNQWYTEEQQEQLFYDSSSNLPFTCIIDTPFCTDEACEGMYRGIEFIHPMYIERFNLNGTDVAHQYSNKICQYVGNKLKQLYRDSLYSRVDFSGIKMSTKGMKSDSDYVEYRIYIPFERVEKRFATTAFDHCGGWGHKPELKKRIERLLNSPSRIVKNRRLWVSKLFKTKEGLEEYWIQWQHSDYQ